MRNVPPFILHSIPYALYSAALQAIAIVFLSPFDYGLFSLWYLAFALGTSLTLSIICEAWSRSGNSGAPRDTWESYWGILVRFSLLFGAGAALISLLLGVGRFAVPLFIALSCSLYRLGARYYASVIGRHAYVGPSDLTGFIAIIACFFTLRMGNSNLMALFWAWAVSSTLTAILSSRPAFSRTAGFRSWFTTHRKSITVLLTDSLLLDAGSIGVPLLLAPVLGTANFGVYRAIASAALPARLILNSIRPFIATRNHFYYAQGKIIAVFSIGGALLGIALFTLLTLLEDMAIFQGQTLGALGKEALPAALFVATNFVGMFYYLVARHFLSERALFLSRFIQLAGAVIGPLFGLYLKGLTGAIWGFVAASIVHSAYLIILNRVEDRQGGIAGDTHRMDSELDVES